MANSNEKNMSNHINVTTASAERTDEPDVTEQGSFYSPRARMVKSIFIHLFFISAGSFTTLAYATVVDMQEYYDTSYQNVTIAQMVKSLGVMTATLLSTPINDIFRRKVDLFMFGFGLLFGITVIAVPWSPHIWVVGICFYASGLFYSTLNTCCVISLTDMWGKRAPITIFGMFSCLAIGNTVAPLMAASFLSKPCVNNDTSSLDMGVLYAYQDNKHHSNTNMTETRMKIPYAISGGSAVLVSFAFLILYISSKDNVMTSSTRPERRYVSGVLHPGSCAGGSTWYGIYSVVSLFIIFQCNNARERGYGMFVFTVANQNLHIPKSKAALILLTYNAVGAISRAFFAVLSFYVPIQVSVLILVFGSLLTHVLAICLALESDAAYWILSCSMSVFTNSFRPAITSWMGRYIDVSGFVMGFITIGVGTGGLTGMFLSNYVREHLGTKAVIYLSLGFTIAVAVLFLPLQIVSHIRGEKQHTVASIVVVSPEPRTREMCDDDDAVNVNVNDRDALLGK